MIYDKIRILLNPFVGLLLDCKSSYTGIEREFASRVDQGVLRWFVHVENMDEHYTARRVMMSEVSGGRVRGRPRLGWMDGVKVAFGNR